MTIDKIDARKLSPDALKALRSQAMRLRQELGLPWRQIAWVMGLNTTTVFGWAQRSATRLRARQAWFPGNEDAPTCRVAP